MFYLPRSGNSLLFDFDSSVLTFYGKLIEGAEVGYNRTNEGSTPTTLYSDGSIGWWLAAIIRQKQLKEQKGQTPVLQSTGARYRLNMLHSVKWHSR